MGAFKYELLLLLSSIIWGSAFVAQQIGMEQGLGPMTFNGLRFALGAISLIPLILDQIKAASGAIAYTGLMSIGIAYTLQVICQKHCPPAPSAMIMSLEGVFAAIAGFLVLHQTLTGRALTGCALILAGVLIVQLLPMRKRKAHALESPL